MKLIIPPILFLLCLTLMGLLRWLCPFTLLFPRPYNLLGLVPMALGLSSGFIGMMTFRRARTNIHAFREADKLETHGPFRHSRNPMYLGLLLILIGAWLLMGTLLPMLGPLVFFIIADRWYIAMEERMLRGKFGPIFDAYRAAVRRWV